MKTSAIAWMFGLSLIVAATDSRADLADPALTFVVRSLEQAAGASIETTPTQINAIDFVVGSGNCGANSGQTIGWEFDVLNELTVTAMAWFDDGADGLDRAHEVGIFDPAGKLIPTTNVVIPAGSVATLDGVWRVVEIEATTLSFGASYIIGGYNGVHSECLSADVIQTVHPDIAFIDATFTPFSPFFERPTSRSAAVNGFYGVGFQANGCFAIDAIDDQFSVINDGMPADLFVLANDACRGDTPISVVVLPGDLIPDRGGSATSDGTKLSYAPAAGYVGFEQFSYSAQDAGLEGGADPPTVDQDTAAVVVSVLEDLAPDAVDDMATAFQGHAIIINVLANDSLGNLANHVGIEEGPTDGSATVQFDGTIRYASKFDFLGEDSFEYRLTDGNGDSDVATVTVGVFFVAGAVPIDIMPSDDGNNLNLRAGQGSGTEVAILSTGVYFDAPGLIDPLTLKFGPREANIWGTPHVRDLDGDGDDDLVVKFLTQQSGIACGDSQAGLSGSTFDARPITGTDAINTFNCPRVRKRH